MDSVKNTLLKFILWVDGDPFGVSGIADVKITTSFILISIAAALCYTAYRLKHLHEKRVSMARSLVSGSGARADQREDLVARFIPKTEEEGGRKILLRIAEFLLRLVNFNKAETQKRLVQAGQRDPRAINRYMIKRGLGMIICPIVLWSIAPVVGFHGIARFAGALIGMFVGGIVVDAILDRQVKTRRDRLTSDLPVLLDLLTIHLEAGTSFDVSLGRAAMALKVSFPAVANDVQHLRSELEISSDRDKTLREFASRMDIAAAKTFVAIVLQSERHGSAIAPALRVLARESRRDVMSAVERRAQKIPTIMQLPMFLFILPAIFMAVISPAIVMVMETLGGS